MECTVRSIRIGEEAECASQIKPALCFRGRKVCHAVVNDETTVRAVELPLQNYDRATPVLYHGQPYDPAAFSMRLRRIGERKGITQRATALLGLPVTDESLPPDEPAQTEKAEPPSTKVPEAGEGSSGRHRDPWSDSPEVAAAKAVAERLRASKRADRPQPVPEKAPKSAKAPKAAKGAKAKPSIAASRTSLKTNDRPNLVRQLATELGLQPQPLRVLLRAAGLRAPYVDIEKMRKAVKK